MDISICKVELAISIIVPVYNVEKYICKCIDSILNQTFTDFELIRIDDGSTDKSGKICDEYKKKDSRIKVIHKKNEGLSSARNIGLDIAQGKYIGFVDSDDYIDENMYEVLYKDIRNNNSDISMCEYDFIYDNNQIEEFNDEKYIINYSNYEALSLFYTSKYMFFVVAWNKLYKKEIFKDIRYPVGKINEDGFIAHKIIFNCKKITYNSEKLYHYYQSNNSITRSKFTIKNLDKLEYMSERITFFKNNGYEDLSLQAKSSFINEFFKLYFRAKSELNINKYKLYCKKIYFIKNINKFINEKSYSYKEKLLFIVFCISDNVYLKIKNRIK